MSTIIWPRGSLRPMRVELVLGRMLIRKRHSLRLKLARVARNVRVHESERGRVKCSLVQPEEHAAVRQHAVGMRPGLGRVRLREAEALVEFDRRADVRGADADLVKAAEHAAVSYAEASRAAPAGKRPRSNGVQPWQCCAMRSARARACSGRALSDGT